MLGDKKRAMMAILGPSKEEEKSEEGPNELHAIAQELINCVHAHDVEGVAHCLGAAFSLLDCEPSEEV